MVRYDPINRAVPCPSPISQSNVGRADALCNDERVKYVEVMRLFGRDSLQTVGGERDRLAR